MKFVVVAHRCSETNNALAGAAASLGLPASVLTHGRMQQVAVGGLGPGEAKSVGLGTPAKSDFKCVWACSDASGRIHIWSYDGQHRRLKRGQRVALQDVFREMYLTAAE